MCGSSLPRTSTLRDAITRAGPLPKEMPPSLENLDLSGHEFHPHKFTGGIPTEWGSLTNLKELNMAYCGLSGA